MKTAVTILGLLEGISFLILLGIAMPLKYMFDNPLAVEIVGPIHGFLFIAYIVALYMGVGKHWTSQALVHGFIAAVLPAGPFILKGKIESGKYNLQ